MTPVVGVVKVPPPEVDCVEFSWYMLLWCECVGGAAGIEHDEKLEGLEWPDEEFMGMLLGEKCPGPECVGDLMFMLAAMVAGEGWPLGGIPGGSGEGFACIFCMGDRICWPQFIGDWIGCCIPDGDRRLAKPGEGIEAAAGDLSVPGAGLRMGPGLVLGILGLLCTDAGLRTCRGLIGEVLFCGAIEPTLG